MKNNLIQIQKSVNTGNQIIESDIYLSDRYVCQRDKHLYFFFLKETGRMYLYDPIEDKIKSNLPSPDGQVTRILEQFPEGLHLEVVDPFKTYLFSGKGDSINVAGRYLIEDSSYLANSAYLSYYDKYLSKGNFVKIDLQPEQFLKLSEFNISMNNQSTSIKVEYKILGEVEDTYSKFDFIIQKIADN